MRRGGDGCPTAGAGETGHDQASERGQGDRRRLGHRGREDGDPGQLDPGIGRRRVVAQEEEALVGVRHAEAGVVAERSAEEERIAGEQLIGITQDGELIADEALGRVKAAPSAWVKSGLSDWAQTWLVQKPSSIPLLSLLRAIRLKPARSLFPCDSESTFTSNWTV